MAAVDPPREDAAAETVAGRQMWDVPGLTEEAGPLVAVPPAGCRGCTHEVAHGVAEWLGIGVPAPAAGGRYRVVTGASKVLAEQLRRIQRRLWAVGWVQSGLIGDEVIYNAGPAADNATQRVQYEVVGAGNGWLDLRGPNPKNLLVQSSRVNPEWPFADPETGTYGRLVYTDTRVVLPAGAVVELLAPSVLARRFYPVISRVVAPETDADDVTFRVEVGGADMSNARAPWDATFPPADGRYWCFVRWQALRPDDWKDFQEPREAQWTPVVQEFVDPAGPTVELRGAEGGATRVWPGSLRVLRVSPAVATEWGPRLLTVRDPESGVYTTTLNIEGLGKIERLRVSFLAEAVGTEERRWPGMGACRWSHRDPSGSYDIVGGEHCGQGTRALGWRDGLFHAGCWLPGRCDRFELTDPTLETVGDAEWLARLWSRAGWVIEQAIEGQRHFTLANRGGPSVAGLAGSFSDRAPAGRFPRREEYAGRSLGVRVEYDLADGEGRGQGLIHGAFYLAPHRFPESAALGAADVEYRPDAFGAWQGGIVASAVPGWAAGKTDLMPWRYSAGTDVYTFDAKGGSLRKVNTPRVSEAYVVAVVPGAAPTGEEGERLRRVLGGS